MRAKQEMASVSGPGNDVTIAEAHCAQSHDGGAAIYHEGRIICLAAERVDRIKHSYDAKCAFDYLCTRAGLTESTSRELWASLLPPAISHPLAHAASTFLPSPFERSLVVVIDGQGPYSDGQVISLSVWVGEGSQLREVESYVSVWSSHLDSC